MKPVIFGASARVFDNNGLGRLSDVKAVTVVEEVNGEYTLTVSCTADGLHVHDLNKGMILLAKANDVDQLQPFRITGFHKSLSGGIDITARHISYDTRVIAVNVLNANSLSSALSTINSNGWQMGSYANAFTLTSSESRNGLIRTDAPVTLRSLLSTDDASLLTVYGLEAKYDRFGIDLKARRGADHGVTLRYGKVVSLETDENADEVYGSIVPYYKDNEGNLRIGSVIYATGHATDGAVPVDVSSYIEQGSSGADHATWKPEVSVVNTAGYEWLNDNKPYIPQRQITVSATELEGINTVELGDTIHVVFESLEITETYRIARLTYDALAERVTAIDLMLDTLAQGKPMKWEGNMGGVAKAVKTETTKIEKKVEHAESLSSQIANGTYKGGLYMDDNNMYAPHIWGGATLHVGARDGLTPGGYNFNVDSNGALMIAPMIKGEPDDEDASLQDDDPDLIYKLHYDPTANNNKGALSLYGVFQVHDANGNVVGSMGRIKGNAGGSSETDGVAFAAGITPTTEVQDSSDSFFLATSGGARLNYKGNKVYASTNYVKMEHSTQGVIDSVVELSSGQIYLSAGGHWITINAEGAKYDGSEIKT